MKFFAKPMLSCVTVLFQFVFEANAQDINTDRPDQTESAITVPKNYFQIETGTLVELNGPTTNWVINSTLFRYGILKNLELRFVSELEMVKWAAENDVQLGVGDFQLGLKYNFIDGDFAFAYLGHVILPNGSEFFSNRHTGVSQRLSLSYDICESTAVGVNLGYDYFSPEDRGFAYTLSIAFGLTERVGFFAEIYGAGNELNELSVLYDNGFTLLINSNLQLDFSVGTGVTAASNFYSGGLSWRLPD